VRNWYRDQYDALDALVEALRTDNGWLEYQLQVVRDAFLDQGAQAAEDASAVERVTMALLERDEALRKAREDLAAMRTVVAEWETEVTSTRAQLQQDRTTLEGARSWQSQAKDKAKEVEQQRVELAAKATALATAEGQLQQEQGARQQAEARLQQERSTLEEARATLEREHMALEEAQCQLQRERAALEEARATLKLQDEEISRLDGELNQLSVSHEDLRQAGDEKDAAILDLQQAAETASTALEAEKKQVKGELSLSAVRLSVWFIRDLLPI
jgi:chromosome segregation ATPase